MLSVSALSIILLSVIMVSDIIMIVNKQIDVLLNVFVQTVTRWNVILLIVIAPHAENDVKAYSNIISFWKVK